MIHISPSKPTPDIRLIVTDMDGTLLDPDRRLPPRFAETVTTLAARGIRWAIASGRQLANLRAAFAGMHLPLDIIAENGALAAVPDKDEPIFRDLTPVPFFEDMLRTALDIPGATAVLCGETCALVHDKVPENFANVGYYFTERRKFSDLNAVLDRSVCKCAVYHPQAADILWPILSRFATPDRRIILSGPNWVDIQPARINKGLALRALLERHNLRPAQAAVFGDYLNDIEMMDGGVHAVAMGNAHPDLAARCAHRTRSNAQNGVMHYLSAHLGLL